MATPRLASNVIHFKTNVMGAQERKFWQGYTGDDDNGDDDDDDYDDDEGD